MLKIVPVEEAVGMTLAHDVTEIIPGKHKGPAFRHGHVIRSQDVPRLLNMGKAHIYIIDLEEGELHEEDAARRLARAAAGPHITFTDPSEGRVNLVADIAGVLKIDEGLLYRFNALGDIIMATLPANEYVKKGTVVAGTRTIPIIVKEELVRKAEAICQPKPIATILPMVPRRVHLIVTGSEVFTGRIKDGFEPVVRKKLQALGCDLEKVKLAPDDPKQIAAHIKESRAAGAELILISGGMSVDPDDQTPEGIRQSGATIECHGFPVLPGSMFLLGNLQNTPILGLSGCVLHDPVSSLDVLLPRMLAGERLTRADVLSLGLGGLQKKHDH
ncbi:MAG TPA: molybdopterin-binding protein [Candidatus Binatia bacterium]